MANYLGIKHNREMGSSCPGAGLSWREAMEIIEIRAPFKGKKLPVDHPASLASLSRVFGVSKCIISKVANHKSTYTQEIEFHVNGNRSSNTKENRAFNTNSNPRADVG